MVSWLKFPNHWVVTFMGVPIECETFRDVVVCSLEAGLPWKEMHIACEEMDKNDHNYASFGFKKRFVCSQKVEL